MKPVIGITPSPIVETSASGTSERFTISAYYVNAVIAAGGIPVVLPPQDGHVDTLLDIVDGLLFSGGADIDPALFGDSDVHPKTYGIHPLRDRFELALIAAAIERNYPILCICRGIQILNVACGGTLYQDVPDQFESTLQHRQQEAGLEPSESVHSIDIESGSLLAMTYGTGEIQTNSFHHQAVKDLAPALNIVGRSPDGLVEAVEHPDRSFVLGVQWHPEMMFQKHPEHLALFKQLVGAAATRRLTGARS